MSAGWHSPTAIPTALLLLRAQAAQEFVCRFYLPGIVNNKDKPDSSVFEAVPAWGVPECTIAFKTLAGFSIYHFPLPSHRAAPTTEPGGGPAL